MTDKLLIEALEETRDTLAKVLIKIRRDAPDLSGKLLGHADQVIARVDAMRDAPANRAQQEAAQEPVSRDVDERDLAELLADCKKNSGAWLMPGWYGYKVGRLIQRMKRSLDFYRQRVELLQTWQQRMRDPERTIVCDILANGQTLPDPNGDRYGQASPAPSKSEALTDEQIAKAVRHLYADDEAASMGLADDIRTVRAALSASGKP